MRDDSHALIINWTRQGIHFHEKNSGLPPPQFTHLGLGGLPLNSSVRCQVLQRHHCLSRSKFLPATGLPLLARTPARPDSCPVPAALPCVSSPLLGSCGLLWGSWVFLPSEHQTVDAIGQQRERFLTPDLGRKLKMQRRGSEAPVVGDGGALLPPHA